MIKIETIEVRGSKDLKKIIERYDSEYKTYLKCIDSDDGCFREKYTLIAVKGDITYDDIKLIAESKAPDLLSQILTDFDPISKREEMKFLTKLSKFDEDYSVVSKVDEKLIAKGDFLTILSAKYNLKCGISIVRETLQIGKNKGVVFVLAETKYKELILVKQPRVFISDVPYSEIPAGYVEENEQPEIAALRELKEETGYVPEKMIFLGEFYSSPGTSGNLHYYFHAKECEKVSNQDLDDSEYIMTYKLPIEKAAKVLKKDLNSMFALKLIGK